MTSVPLFSKISSFFKANVNLVDDSVDRISSWFSAAMMISFCGLSCAALTIGKSMVCMTPDNYGEDWRNFIQNTCFAMTHISPIEENSTEEFTSKVQYIAYFPWIPFFFFFHALAFGIPLVLWTIGSRFGIDLKALLKDIERVEKMDKEQRQQHLEKLAPFIITVLHYWYNGPPPRIFVLVFTPIMFIIKKWLYVAVAVAQFVVICATIGGGNMYWGSEALAHTLRNTYHPSVYFPLFSWCRVEIWADNNVQFKPFKCLLAMNVLFEKLYIAAYFWLLFLIVVSSISAVQYTVMFLSPSWRYNFVRRILKPTRETISSDDIRAFTDDYLGANGILLLVVTRFNYGSFTTEEVASHLWVHFKSRLSQCPSFISECRPQSHKSYLYESLPHN